MQKVLRLSDFKICKIIVEMDVNFFYKFWCFGMQQIYIIFDWFRLLYVFILLYIFCLYNVYIIYSELCNKFIEIGYFKYYYLKNLYFQRKIVRVYFMVDL